jgi:hypothetical protein
VLDKLKSAASKVAETASSLSQAGSDQLRTAVAEITAGLEILKANGSEVGKMEIRLGVIPSAILSVSRSEQLTVERLEAIKAEHSGQRYLSSLMSGLIVAERMASSLQTPGQRLVGFKVELSAPPAVSLIYEPIRRGTTDTEALPQVTLPLPAVES